MFKTYIQSPQILSEAERIPSSSMHIFIHHLEGNSYSPKTIKMYIGAVIHFSSWQQQQRLSCTDVTLGDKANFINLHMPSCQCFKEFSRSKKTIAAALSHWIRLVGQGAVNQKELSYSDSLVLAFDQYLKNVAGLSPATRLYRRRYATDFLKWLSTQTSVSLDSVSAEHLYAFICHRATEVSLATTAAIACSLSSFVRFLSVQQICQFEPHFCVPRPKLPYCLPLRKSLSEEELDRLLQAIDRSYPVGMRDYAITRCLIDLGVRTSDVANLRLDDINWRNKVITINPGKSRRQHQLPIPETLMGGLVEYITKARPETQSRHIFVYHRAPFGKSVKTSTIRGVVRRVFIRAGFEPSQTQVHRLRHTMATRLLTSDVPLKIIADVLGHQSIDTTTRYTHINRQKLLLIALPWPGSTGL